MKENMEKEDFNLENDAELEDAEEETSDDKDLDYEQENDHYQDQNQTKGLMLRTYNLRN